MTIFFNNLVDRAKSTDFSNEVIENIIEIDRSKISWADDLKIG
jgi:hypothetical protein